MTDALFLALRYLWYSKWRSLVQILALSLTISLPVFSTLAASVLEDSLLERGDDSPILVGAKGNEFELTMNALYFRGRLKETIPYKVQLELEETHFSAPIYVKHSTNRVPIVGTSLEYFQHRKLQVAFGRNVAVIGELVAGASVAEQMNLSLGDTLRSDQQNLYNISAGYPLVLTVVGILAPSAGPDDDAFFADVKTAWALDGFFHGHDEVTKENAITKEGQDLGEEENLEASAAIFMFQELSAKNLSSFHMHGSDDELPISGVLVIPEDQRRHDQLLGDFALSEHHQAIRPTVVIEDILSIVLRIQQALWAIFTVLAATTVALLALSLKLSLELRAEELSLMQRIGGSRRTIRQMIAAEIGIVLIVASILATIICVFGLWVLTVLL